MFRVGEPEPAKKSLAIGRRELPYRLWKLPSDAGPALGVVEWTMVGDS
jgi:hypothetical protein